ncbi:MAG: hypothetical protein ACHQ49_01260, partial [Elusimicrobiota bacterium]
TMGRFCLLTTPGCPPLTFINPGWPALLAPLTLLSDGPGLSQAFSALLLAAAPLALWKWLRSRASETNSLLAAALFASCPLVLAQSGAVMTEVPYVLLLIAMLHFVDNKRPAAAGLCAAALLLTRTASLAVIPALFLPFCDKPQRKNLWSAAKPFLIVCLLWAAWSWKRGRTIGKFDLLPSTYGGGVWWKPFAVAASNARFYAGEWGGCFLPPSQADGAAAVILGSALMAAAAWGLVGAFRRRGRDPAAWALVGTATLLLVWGFQYERYLITLLPLLLWALSRGFEFPAGRYGLALLLAMQLGFQTLPRLGRPSPWARPELSRTYAWLAARPAPNLLGSAEYVRDGWHSGLPNTPLPSAKSGEDFAMALKINGIRYVLRVDGQDYGLEHDASSALRREVEADYRRLEDPRLFRKVHEEPEERAAVYEPL